MRKVSSSSLQCTSRSFKRETTLHSTFQELSEHHSMRTGPVARKGTATTFDLSRAFRAPFNEDWASGTEGDRTRADVATAKGAAEAAGLGQSARVRS